MYNPDAMKQILRTQKMLERLNHKTDEKVLKDQHIVSALSESSYFKRARIILFYLPIHGEVDISQLFNKYKGKKKFVLPRVCKNGNLNLHFITDLSETENGAFNIKEPLGNLKEASPKDLDLILVPGTVFAKDGHRIGYGKGFYDRLLKNTSAIKIGIAYEFQIVENIPAQSHDSPMDLIATEKGIQKIPFK